MTSNDCAKILVCWEQQRRILPLKGHFDLNTIKQSICRMYHLESSKQFRKYQIQFYDGNYKTFIDLSSQTFSQFQQLVQILLSSDDSPPKSSKIWRLKIITKTVPTDTSMSTTSDTEDDQQVTNELESEPTNVPVVEDDSSPEIGDDSHPLNFHFENDIACTQRVQYESDTKRRNTNNRNASGVVFLQGLELHSLGSYPRLHFKIPQTKLTADWYLHLYILTECDSKGNYYLHASKGIYDNQTLLIDRFGPISNSNLVNPYKIELTEDNIQQGTYDCRLRVCNLPNLVASRCEKLHQLPELNSFVMYQDPRLISPYTSEDLNFSSKKYHIGCILLCENTVQDRCISKLAVEDGKRTESRTKKCQS